MIEKNVGKGLESKSSQKEKLKESFSEELFLDLIYGINWEKHDKLSNQYAYEMIKKGHGELVLKHLEKFNPTRQLFEKLLEDEDNCTIDVYEVESFKGLNKGTLEKILWYEPRRIGVYDSNGVNVDFGVDKNTWKRYVIIAKEFDKKGLDSTNSSKKKKDPIYKRIYEKYFSMDVSKINEQYWKIQKQMLNSEQKEAEKL